MKYGHNKNFVNLNVKIEWTDKIMRTIEIDYVKVCPDFRHDKKIQRKFK